MKCVECDKPMLVQVGDFDYTRLADLRGKSVTLTDVTFFQCEGCGPAANYVEIPRLAALHRELAAAKALRVKRLWCRFTDVDEWVFVMNLVMSPRAAAPRRPRRREGAA